MMYAHKLNKLKELFDFFTTDLGVTLSITERQIISVNFVKKIPLKDPKELTGLLCQMAGGTPKHSSAIARKITELGLCDQEVPQGMCPGHCGLEYCKENSCLHNSIVAGVAEREALGA